MDLLQAFFNRIQGKKILIQGLGLNGGGVGTALFFLKNGFAVTITDMKTVVELQSSVDELKEYIDNITFVLGKHQLSDFIEADIVIKGPGVSPKSEYIQAAIKNGAEILSDIGIFCEISPCPIYAVTGSKGKSTTVSAIYSIFKSQTDNSFLGGNITISPLTFYNRLDDDSLVILELSSWQLRDIENIHYAFKGAVFTNLMNDHQNYYQSMDAYFYDKKIIATNQTKKNFVIIPCNDAFIKREKIDCGQTIVELEKDLYFKDGDGYIEISGNAIKLFSHDVIKIKGEHNRLNILFAAGLSYLAGCNPEAIENGISLFSGVPFRMEKIREWKGVTFVNDTTATIPEAACFAVESYGENVIWIAGGNDKDLDFSCVKKIESIPKKIYLLPGNGTDKLKKALKRNDYLEYSSLQEIINHIATNITSGETVLLSPGCTSFGLFQNEFHRGRVFNELVNSL